MCSPWCAVFARPRIIGQQRGRPLAEPTALKMSRYPRALLAHRRPGRRDFRFHSIEVEAGTLLHRRGLDGGRGGLLPPLLDEKEAPEFVLAPLGGILRPRPPPPVRPTAGP